MYRLPFVPTLPVLSRLLHERAAQAVASGSEALPEVQLRADAAVPYGRVVEVMDLAQQAGQIHDEDA